MVRAGSLHRDLPSRAMADEITDTIVDRPGLRIERIVSSGQATLEEEWYDQASCEWVLVVAGAARLRIEGEPEDRDIAEGDWLLLPAHCRHRVTWTSETPPTIWLAVHFRTGA